LFASRLADLQKKQREYDELGQSGKTEELSKLRDLNAQLSSEAEASEERLRVAKAALLSEEEKVAKLLEKEKETSILLQILSQERAEAAEERLRVESATAALLSESEKATARLSAEQSEKLSESELAELGARCEMATEDKQQQQQQQQEKKTAILLQE
jgi:hypothetical protein